jgi:ABC-type metal ion transport system substrate-binding protein
VLWHTDDISEDHRQLHLQSSELDARRRARSMADRAAGTRLPGMIATEAGLDPNVTAAVGME